LKINVLERKEREPKEVKKISENLAERIRRIPIDQISIAQWQSALSLWKKWRQLTLGIKNHSILNSPIFRVAGQIAGKHCITSPHFSVLLAEGIAKCFPAWKSAARNFEMEIYAYLRFSRLYFGLAFTERSLSLEQVSRERTLGATALRPAIAYSLARLAAIHPGEIIVDPLAGCGTIPQIAAECWPLAYYFIGDIAKIAIEKSTKNQEWIEMQTHQSRCEIIEWDSRKLPFAINSIDAIITDMPFGKRMGNNYS